MPFYRKGPPGAPRGEGASQELDATSSGTAATAAARAKAKAKPKAQAKQEAQPKPTPWATSSSTPPPSGAGADGAAGLRLDPKRVKDEVYMMETFAAVARHFQQKDMLFHLEHRRRSALRAKAASMPAKQRIEHLQKRHRNATAELKKLIKAQEATDSEIRLLQARSREQYEAVEDQRELVEDIRGTLEEAELDLPPTATPKQVGRQVHPSDLRAAIQKATIPELLEELSGKYSVEFGEALSDIVGRRTMQGFDMLHSAHAELTEERKKAQSQVETDRRAALQLHQELNGLDVKPGDKRGRTVDVDKGGDERMRGVENEESGSDEEWQTAQGRRRRGKGRAGVPAGSQATTSSVPGLPNPFPVGPLATTPRPTPAVGSVARHPSPLKPSATGTPAVASEAGTLQPSGAQEEVEMIPVLSLLSVTAQDEPETACLDSLPSTPRVSEGEKGEPETPGPAADQQANVHVQPMEQDSEPAGTAPTAVGPEAPVADVAPPPGAGDAN